MGKFILLVVLLVTVYTSLSLLFTSPLTSHVATHTAAGSHSGDQCQTIWFFWWTKTAVFDTGQNPFWTDVIYYPHGTGVGYQIALFTDFMAVGLASLLGVAVNAPTVFNSLLLFAFVLTGLASFTLIRELSGNTAAAFIGSLFVTFSPYRLWNLDHLNLLSMGWALFAVYFAVRYFRRVRVTDLAGAVIGITLSFYTDFFTTAVTALLLIAWVVFDLKNLFGRRDRMRIAGGVCAGVVATLALCYPGLKPLFEWSPDWNAGWMGSELFGAGILEFVRPHWSARSVGPGEAYLGWILIGLSLLGVFACRREREVRRWGLIAVIFLVLSLGPSLRVEDSLHWRGLLPYRWLYEILPILRLARTPGRFVMAANLALAVVAAVGIKEWLRLLSEGKATLLARVSPIAVSALVALGIYLECGDTPISLAPMEVPRVYNEVAADSSLHVICDLPILDKYQISNWYMYWQTAHGKKTVNGFLTRHSPGARTLVDQLQRLDSLGGDGLNLLRGAGVDAIVIHEPGRESRLSRLGRQQRPVIQSDTSRAPSR